MAPKPERLPALDGLRAVAVLLVVVWHAAFTDVTDPRDNFAWWAAGPMGVRLFFVISGFLITSILLAAKESALAFGAPLSGVYRAFLARRALRILPPAYLTAISLRPPPARSLLFAGLTLALVPWMPVRELGLVLLCASIVRQIATHPVPWLTHPALLSVGRVSYSLYLWNSLIVLSLPAYPPLVLAPLTFLLSYSVALALWVVVEAPLISLRDRFPYVRHVATTQPMTTS